ncbi:MAG: M48 family peptidase, partial [Actinomycetota bacterium]|nr:M48 family peptidase [Actinomycetota bacterium]
MSPAERRAAWAWLALTTLTLVVLATVLVPWDWLPGGNSAPVDPTAGLPADTLAAIDNYRDTVVPLGLASTAVSLAVALGLALTPMGARLVRHLPGQRWWPLHLAATVLTLIVIGRLAVLPLAVPAELTQRDAGLST